MISYSWQLVTEECLEAGWSEVDINNLEDLVASVNSLEDLKNWTPKQRSRKMLVVDELVSMAIRHSILNCNANIARNWVDKG